MPAGMEKEDSMFSVREVPWHGLGAVLDAPPKNIDDALKKAGLAWDVVQKPVHFEGREGDLVPYVREAAVGKQVPAGFVNVRSDTHATLGIVSDRYRVMQNKEAFSFLANLIGSDLHFETAGSLNGGKRVWVQVRLPKWIEVGGDACVIFAFVTNSHDGYRAVRAKAGSRRIVCQNTLSWALGEANNTYAITHLGDPQARLHEAREVLGLTINFSKQFKELGDRLASQKFTEAKLKRVLEHLYPTDDVMSERKVANRIDSRNHVTWLFREGPTVGNAPGSAWSAMNAAMEYIDYGESTDSSTPKLTRVMDDPTGLKQRAFELFTAAAGVSA